MSDWFDNVKNGWTYNVKKDDYVMVVSNLNNIDKRLRKVTRVTTRSIYVDKMQFSKFTKSQKNNKFRLEPFLSHHINHQI